MLLCRLRFADNLGFCVTPSSNQLGFNRHNLIADITLGAVSLGSTGNNSERFFGSRVFDEVLAEIGNW